MAGDVSVAVIAGNLFIRGDDLDNSLRISSGAEAGAFVITGNTSPDETTINGSSARLTVTGVTKRVIIQMGDGEDFVYVNGAAFADDLLVDLGAGDDYFSRT